MTTHILDLRAHSVSKPRYRKKVSVALQALVLELGGQRLALPVAHVEQVIHQPLVTSLPGTPEFIQGLLNRKGEILCVLNIAKWIDAPTSETPEYVAVISHRGRKLGLMVDRPVEFRNFAADELREISVETETEEVSLFANISTDLVAVIDLPILFQNADIRNKTITHRGVRTKMEELP